MDKFFTLDEAESAIPLIKECLQKAIKAKGEIDGIQGELDVIASRIHLLGGSQIDPTAVAQRRQAKDHAVRSLEDSLREIDQWGCLVKDLDVGLIDFPALLEGEEVYLCWKLGEAKIEYWHRVNEGFAGRKRIKGEFGRDSSLEKTN